MDLFLDVERRGMDDEVAPVLLILAAPDELGIQVAVAPLIGNADGIGILLLQHGLVLGRGDVLPFVSVVLDRFDGLGGGGFLRHGCGPFGPFAAPLREEPPSHRDVPYVP